MSYPFSVTVTLLRTAVTSQDSRGNDVTSTTPTAVKGGVVWPESTTDHPTQARDLTTTNLVWWAPPGTVVLPTDQATVAGYGTRPFAVRGAPFAWRSPFTGHAPGVEVHLTRTEA